MKEFIRRNTNMAGREQLKKIYRFCNDFLFTVLDLVLSPLTLCYAIALKAFRKRYFRSLPISRAILLKVGVFPINDHYYEPLFNPARLRKPLSQDRNLPGLDLNIEAQLALLSTFNYNEELLAFPMQKKDDSITFSYDHGPFNAGDAEYLYSMIRHFKPSRMIEIGCGSSTLMAINAIRKNKAENPDY
ncbi:MAG TPA: hypothetical protein VNZ86_19720, partial [Bacteroidia bacterium]|nr:hypothetical protein [Bacteroidia bacterium]